MELQFPEVLDSTLLNAWASCPTQAMYSGFRKIRPVGLRIDLHAGAAFARGLETTRRAFYERGESEESAIAQGFQSLVLAYGDPQIIKDTPKTWDRVAGALVAYFDEYPLGRDSIKPACYNNKWAIEFSFAVPLDIWGFRHPETNNPLILAGRTDMIGTFNQSDWVVDEKTTKTIGEGWANKWTLRAQFMCYMWAARLYGFSIAGTIVRGIAIRKTGYDFAEALLRRNDAMLDRWERETRSRIGQMLRAYNWWKQTRELHLFNFALGEACEAYGGCPFKQLCLASDAEAHIRTDYEENTWNPLTREESNNATKQQLIEIATGL